MSGICEKRIETIVENAIEGSGMFYTVKEEPIPSKTCFDVVLKIHSNPALEYPVTVNIPKNYPFSPPTITSKSKKRLEFKFLRQSQWKPSMDICEVLIEASNVVSQRDLDSRRPVLPPLRPPSQEKNSSSGGSKSPKRTFE